MAKPTLIEQLDDALQAILAHPDAPLPRVNPRVAPLLRIAAALRDLPREDFKARLKTALERSASMASKPVAIPEDFQTITPYLIAADAAALIDFLKQGFGAEELFRAVGSAGGIHCNVRLGNSMLMVGGGGPGLSWSGSSRPTALHLYVKDADAAYRRALEAGAISIGEPMDQFYGDREAGVKDLAGNHWYIATHKATGHMPEGFRSVTPFLHPIGAPKMIDFLKLAFGAEELGRAQSPDGVIHHATLRVGDSFLEMGEAHGESGPMPTMFYMYVSDVDASYDRALKAGGKSISAPAKQPYGDRVGAVQDPFGNDWYLAVPAQKAS